MSGGRPSAVIFDFNGVLTRPPASATLRRLRALAELEEDVLVDGYWRHRPAYDRGTLDAAEYWSLVGRGGGRTYTDSRVDELVWADAETWGRPNPAVVRLFLSLARRGIRSAILSNTPRDIWQLLAGRHEWMSAADVTTLSFAVGNAKPERSIFVRCLSDLDVAPSQALFIDDRPENVEAAKALGLRALHYRTPQDLERWVTDALCER